MKFEIPSENGFAIITILVHCTMPNKKAFSQIILFFTSFALTVHEQII
jgi:hypothetical protein